MNPGKAHTTVAAFLLLPALTLGGDFSAGQSVEAEVVPATQAPVSPSVQAQRGFLGVVIREVDEEAVERLDLPEERGALVDDVRDGSPADDAGLQEDDVIVTWDGEEVQGTMELRRLVRETPPGRQVQVAYVRDGQRRTTTVTVGERSGPSMGARAFVVPRAGDWSERSEEARERAEKVRDRMAEEGLRWRNVPGGRGHVLFFGHHGRARLGVELQDLTPQLAEYFGLADRSGALVASVREDSPAREAGFRAGDVILAIDGERVEDSGDAVRIVREKDAGTVEIRILRDGREQTLSAELEERPERSPRRHHGELIVEPVLDELEATLELELAPALERLDVELAPALEQLELELGPALEQLGPVLDRRLRQIVVPSPPRAPRPPRSPKMLRTV